MATLNAATVAVNFVAGTAEYVGGLDKATRAGESWEKSLRRQIQTMEMGADASRLYDLALRGADMSVRDSIRLLLEKKAAMEAAVESERRAAERTASVQREAVALYEQTRTPAERYAVQVANLRDLLTRGAVSQEVYNRALAQAREQFQQTSGASQRAADIQRRAAEQRAAAEKKAAEQAAQAARLHQEAVARGRAVYDQTRTPAERYRTTIGELGVMLRKGHIDQTTYSRAMAKARNEMMQSSAAFQGLTGGLSGVMAATGPVGIAIGVVVGAVVALAASSVAAGIAMFNLGKRGADYVDQLKDQAENLSLTLRGLEALRFAAERNGSSVQSVESAIEKMNKSLGEAVTKGGDAAEAFSRIGLSANQLATMAPDAAFKQIADSIAAMKNPYEQAYAAQQIFGKGAQQIMTLLRAGSGAIDEATKKVEEYGRAVSSDDAKAIEDARDAWNDIRKIIEGIGIQLAVAFSPSMKAIAGDIQSLVALFGGVKNIVRTVRDQIFLMGSTIEAALDPLNAEKIMERAWKTLEKMRRVDALRDKLAGMQSGKSAGGNSSVDLDRAAAAVERQRDVAKTIDGLQQQARASVMSKEAMVMLDLATKGATAEQMRQAAAFMETIRQQEQQARNNKIIQDLQFQADTFGMNAKQIAIYKMALDGATASQMAEAAALYDKIDAMKQQQAMMDEGKRLTEQMMTEEEKRAKQLERYQELLDSGAITQETYNRAVNKMQERTDMKDLGGQEVKSIASREIRFNASIPGAKRFTDELKAPTKETAKNTESIAKSAEETRDLIKERFGFDVVDILG
jgi:hypothetical protein